MKRLFASLLLSAGAFAGDIVELKEGTPLFLNKDKTHYSVQLPQKKGEQILLQIARDAEHEEAFFYDPETEKWTEAGEDETRWSCRVNYEVVGPEHKRMILYHIHPGNAGLSVMVSSADAECHAKDRPGCIDKIISDFGVTTHMGGDDIAAVQMRYWPTRYEERLDSASEDAAQEVFNQVNRDLKGALTLEFTPREEVLND